MQPFNDDQIKAIRAIIQEEMDAAKVRLADGLTDEEYADLKLEWQKANKYAKLKQERNNAREEERSQSRFDFLSEYEDEQKRSEDEREKRRKERIEEWERYRKARREARVARLFRSVDVLK